MKENFGIMALYCAGFFIVMALMLRVNVWARRTMQLPLEELMKGQAEYVRNLFILKLSGATFFVFLVLYLLS